jgi:predicted nucleotidyltransferase
MIILFGSYAKGSYTEHKYTGCDGLKKYEYVIDYDLQLVIKKMLLRKHSRRKTAYAFYVKKSFVFRSLMKDTSISKLAPLHNRYETKREKDRQTCSRISFSKN